VRIPRDIVDELIAHAREDEPNECCGILGGADGAATSLHRVPSASPSPLRFEKDPMAQYKATSAVEEAGEELVGIYHSHTKTKAYPSQTDVNFARLWPDQLWVIVSLADAEDPGVRGYWIRDGEITEEPIDVA